MGEIKKVTEEKFEEEVINCDKPVVVDFTANWCGPCKKVLPILEELADEFEGKAFMKKVDVGESPNVAEEHGVLSLPVVIVFHQGKEIERISKVPKKQQLTDCLENLI